MYGIINLTPKQNVKSTMFDDLLSTIAPHLCYSCGKTGTILCDNCKYDITSEYFVDCISCGGPAGATGRCFTCNTTYSRGWCVGERSGALEKIVDSYKFYNNYAAHRDLAALLSERIGLLPENCTIVPVPTVPSHIRQRGYDHIYLIAKRLAKLQNRPLQRLLYRRTSTKQRGENRKNRLRQASQAFGARSVSDPERVYLLIDDVVTTGATLQYASKALTEAGAVNIWAAAIARQPLD